jgi:hypothetical protein
MTFVIGMMTNVIALQRPEQTAEIRLSGRRAMTNVIAPWKTALIYQRI